MKKIKFFIIFTVIYFLNSVVLASDSAHKISRDDVLKKYSFEQIQNATTYMAARIEFPAQKILKCDPPLKKVKAWISGPVRSLLDSKKTEVLKDYKQDPAHFTERIKICSTRCDCDVLTGIAEDSEITDSILAQAHQENLTQLKVEIKKQDHAQTLKCAKNADWLCKSDLLKFLESQ